MHEVAKYIARLHKYIKQTQLTKLISNNLKYLINYLLNTSENSYKI